MTRPTKKKSAKPAAVSKNQPAGSDAGDRGRMGRAGEIGELGKHTRADKDSDYPEPES